MNKRSPSKMERLGPGKDQTKTPTWGNIKFCSHTSNISGSWQLSGSNDLG